MNHVNSPSRGWLVPIVVVITVAAYFAGRHSSSSANHATGPTTAPAAADKQLWTCSMHPQVIQDHPGLCPICHMELTPLKSSSAGSLGVLIDPVIVQNMGVRTTEVSKGPLVRTVRAVGYLREPEPLHRDINLRVSGWIEKLYANIDGMMIKEGQPLFDLYSPELTLAVDELIGARAQVARAPDDATSKNVADSAKQKLLQFGLPEQQIEDLAKLKSAPRTIPILAPIGGHLTTKMVYEGAAIKAGDLVMRIASRHEMWIDAQVYEQELGLIHEGQTVHASVLSQPGRTYDGRVLFIHPHLDPATRTATVRIEVLNQDYALRENMYASAEIAVSEGTNALMIPREAVIDSGRKQIAFVAMGGGRFEPRDLQLGAQGQNGTVEVRSGLSAGETVVTSGQFLLDSESRLKEAIAKHLAGGAAPTSKPSIPTTQATVEVVAGMDEVTSAYLAMAKDLGALQQSDTPLKVDELLQAARRVADDGRSSAAARELASALATAAVAMDGKPLPRQREAFVVVGEAMKALLHRAPPTAQLAPVLYVFHCPMAFGAKGANWVQDTNVIANPFYATSMKECGSVAEEIKTRTDAANPGEGTHAGHDH